MREPITDELQRIVDYAVAKVRTQVLSAGGYCSLGHVHPCDCAGAMWTAAARPTVAAWRYPVLSAEDAAKQTPRHNG